MRITSYGAAQEVTGSKHLLEIDGKNILLDCGMCQGRREESSRKNRRLDFDVHSLHAVVLSHAHIDHSGVLPMLIRHGYRGPIFATPATRDLCAIMLLDSSHIQARDAKWLSKKHMEFVAPLYGDEDVRETMRRFICVPYDMPMDIVPGVKMTFQDAGHVLGSAMVQLKYRENGSAKTFLFSGDIGRKKIPILRDPWIPEEADAVIMESTYGDRDHDPIESLDTDLAKYINRTAERGGKVIVPSFALERSQEFVYALKRLEAADAIPTLPVFVDSPLTVNITEVFRLHADLFDEEMRDVMEHSGDPFELQQITYIRNVEQSKRLNTLDKPAIIISAAGMCEHGRILHHLRNNCANEKNTILIIGFQAKNTLGRRIVERRREIRIFGVQHELNAEVQVLNSLSAHAGRSELLEFGARFKDCAEKIMLVHGENGALDALKMGLQDLGCSNVHVQVEGKTVELS
jgi:metallo-beta-lactamase family protein